MTASKAEYRRFNARAPVVLVAERELAAPPSHVWSVLTGVAMWPHWHRGIGFAVLRGSLAPGTALHWKGDGMRIASRVAEVEPERRIGWTIRTLGAHGYQRWTLDPSPSGGTRLRLEESWEGLAVRLLGGTLRRTLERSRAEWLNGLDHQSAESVGLA